MINELIDRYFSDWQIIIFQNLVLALLCGAGILAVFYITYRSVSVSRSFSFTLLILPPVACMVAQVITNDIVLAVGMVGALSIIRFRHSMKEAKNLVFIFWAVTAGIACGLSLRWIVTVSCAIIAVFVLVVHFFTERKSYGTLSVKACGTAAAAVGEGDARGIEKILEEVENIFKDLSLKYEIKYKSINETSDILYELRHKKRIDNVVDEVVCEKIMLVDGVSAVKFIKM